MANKLTERVKIIGLKIKNIYRIRAAELEIDPEKGLYEITGKNFQGKTSIRRAIEALIGGAGARSESFRKDDAGKDEPSSVEGLFTNGFEIQLRPTERNPKGTLIVEGPDGTKYGQKEVDRWSGNGAADLMALRTLPPAKLTETLLSLGTDPTLPRNLKALRLEREEVKEGRPFSEKQKAERTKKPEGERPEEVDTSAEMDRLSKLEAGQRNLEEAERASEAAIKKEETESLAVAVRKRAVEATEVSLAHAKAALKEAEAHYQEAYVAKTEASRVYRETPDLSDDIAEVRERIRDAKSKAQDAEPWKAHDRAQVEIKEFRATIKAANERLDEIKVAEKKLLADAGIEIKGLSFSDDGEPLLWDRALDVASGRQWVEFAAEVAYAKEDGLGFFLIDEANGLDYDGMLALKETSEKYGVTAIVCRIEPSGAGEVIICSDGYAWNEGNPPEEVS